MSTAFSALLAPLLTCLGKCKARSRPTAEELALALTLAFNLAFAFALALTGPHDETARLFALSASWPTAGFHHDEPLPLTLRT